MSGISQQCQKGVMGHNTFTGCSDSFSAPDTIEYITQSIGLLFVIKIETNLPHTLMYVYILIEHDVFHVFN